MYVVGLFKTALIEELYKKADVETSDKILEMSTLVSSVWFLYVKLKGFKIILTVQHFTML